LAIRPLFHQLEKRVKAHVLVAFLGYALLVTLKPMRGRWPGWQESILSYWGRCGIAARKHKFI
jgi:predicted cobalt transporter CbtA